jgi:opine dehydrogenase
MNAKLYRERASDPANIWVKWLSLDVPFAHVPFVSLAELANVPVPIYRAVIEIFGAVVNTDFWKTGLTLDKLGLESLTKNEILRYVTEGET